MELVFKDLLTKWWQWGFLLLAIVSAAFLIVGLTSGDVTRPENGWLAAALYLGLAGFLAQPIWCAARSSHKYLLKVCVWTLVLVAVAIPFSFFFFFCFFESESSNYDKVLNVIPVLVAIWAAGLGWLVHFKLSTKAHRTNNSFSILMETRKSGEYLRRAEMVSKHFPPGSGVIGAPYDQFFDPKSGNRLYGRTVANAAALRAAQAQQAQPGAQGQQATQALAQAEANAAQLAIELEQLEAVNSMRYLLNYFEFMAIGIKVGDLDENLLYETIGPPVVAVFRRGESLVDYLNHTVTDKQRLAFIELKALVTKWEQQVNSDSADVANGKKPPSRA